MVTLLKQTILLNIFILMIFTTTQNLSRNVTITTVINTKDEVPSFTLIEQFLYGFPRMKRLEYTHYRNHRS